jgi:hypothetical protein
MDRRQHGSQSAKHKTRLTWVLERFQRRRPIEQSGCVGARELANTHPLPKSSMVGTKHRHNTRGTSLKNTVHAADPHLPREGLCRQDTPSC